MESWRGFLNERRSSDWYRTRKSDLRTSSYKSDTPPVAADAGGPPPDFNSIIENWEEELKDMDYDDLVLRRYDNKWEKVLNDLKSSNDRTLIDKAWDAVEQWETAEGEPPFWLLTGPENKLENWKQLADEVKNDMPSTPPPAPPAPPSTP